MASTINVAAQKTTRKGLRAVAETPENARTETTASDTIVPDSSACPISVAGYDKPLRSSRETFFITNRTPHDILGLRMRIEYSDIHGRTLHQRELFIPIDLPSGATRQASVKSWDVQKSFHYRLSPKPKRSDGTAYDVKCSVISATVKTK